ncbi:DNA cytosine methyltransferase [Psychrobacillus soli]|uniref:Cytosine-specific methyltransferase n=1 Tax=Psychrobacillus soli TaxID=1543965 RepID=A0A544T2I6_9BACI|nr:DNA cytosine methyltransferase [Psychrobacillus soli]TQR11645.1 DNA cytosine methyltransferase [Psychrobacillus soli]
MFKAFEDLTNGTEHKSFIAYVEDAYKHLQILTSSLPSSISKSKVINVIIELGFIKNSDTLEAFTKFIEKNSQINIDEFFKLVSTNDHTNEFCKIPKICASCRTKLVTIENQSSKPTLVDLFCGSGGMSLGFTQAGFRTIFANDIEPSCIETYLYNHPEVNPKRVLLGDIQDIASTVNDYTLSEHVDIVIGGPPCQGFSNANQQRIIDDPRNRLYKEFVNVVATIRPTFFVMENVIGMKIIAEQIIQDFESVGYKVSFEVLNAIEFGVPQQRKRIIFIGNKIGVDNETIFKKIHKKNSSIETTDLKDAISDLPPLKALNIKNATNHESKEHGYFITSMTNYHKKSYLSNINCNQTPQFIYNHKARYNNERDIEIFSRLHQGDKSDDPKIADIMPYTNRMDIFKDKYYKLIYNQPCKTITAHMKFDCNMYIHPTQARGLTPREAARIQSYPDDYYFKGPYTKTYMQIGNSVPPVMAKGIASEIIKFLQVQKEDEQLIFPLSIK